MRHHLFGMVCALAFSCVEQVWAKEASSPQMFTDVMRDFTLSVEISSNGERSLRIYAKESGALLQTITAQECLGDPGFFPFAGDFDFDGHEDFACKSTWHNGEQHMAFFLYDAKKKRFAFSFELIGFEIQSDPQDRTLTSVGLDGHFLKKQTYQMRGSRPALARICTADGQVSESPDFQCYAVATPDSVLRDFYFEYDGYRNEDAGKNAALRVYRKKTGKLVQTLELAEDFTYSELDDKPPVGVPDYSWASKLRAGDFNFDGLEDFAVLSTCGNVNCVEDYYLYNPGRQEFRRGFSLSGHGRVFDPASKTVTISARGNAATHYQTTYRVQGFALIPEYACTRYIGFIEPDRGANATLSVLSGGDLALDLYFAHDVEPTRAFSGTVHFSLKDKSASPQCPLRLQDKEALAHDAEGQARRVAWTLEVECDRKPSGTLFLILSDADGDGIEAGYRPAGDDKVIPLELGYFCEACDEKKANCE
ncbi:MAG: hypothetical protein LBU11_06610 [Zoogloeaceae bacterium]|nr:hypothetical protein [Zoogloeaceae bacterium]